MVYWSLFFLLAGFGYFVTGLLRRHNTQKKIIIKVIEKDGSVQMVETYLGRDPEVDSLIKELKLKRSEAL